MKISRIVDLHADAGWRVFSFLKIETEAELVGWSEYNESYGSKGLTVVIMKLAEMLIGQDPRPVERDRRHPGEVRNGSVTRALQRCPDGDQHRRSCRTRNGRRLITPNIYAAGAGRSALRSLACASLQRIRGKSVRLLLALSPVRALGGDAAGRGLA